MVNLKIILRKKTFVKVSKYEKKISKKKGGFNTLWLFTVRGNCRGCSIFS